MKIHFKYNLGYINLDEENLCFTHTGVWSETKLLKENTSKVSRKNNIITLLRTVGALIIIILLLFGLIFIENINYFSFLSVIIKYPLIGLIIVIILNFNKKTGSAFRIPLEKILQIEIKDYCVNLKYLNGDNKEQIIKLKRISYEGVVAINDLKTNFS